MDDQTRIQWKGHHMADSETVTKVPGTHIWRSTGRGNVAMELALVLDFLAGVGGRKLLHVWYIETHTHTHTYTPAQAPSPSRQAKWKEEEPEVRTPRAGAMAVKGSLALGVGTLSG